MRSDLTRKPRTWAERCQAMREDYESGAYDWLFFKILVNRLDASREHNYERMDVLEMMEDRIRNLDFDAIERLLETLESLC